MVMAINYQAMAHHLFSAAVTTYISNYLVRFAIVIYVQTATILWYVLASMAEEVNFSTYLVQTLYFI